VQGLNVATNKRWVEKKAAVAELASTKKATPKKAVAKKAASVKEDGRFSSAMGEEMHGALAQK